MVLAIRSRPLEMYAAIRGMGGSVLRFGDHALVIDDVGLFINHRTQQPTGVDAMVRLFRHGYEVPVDPHRPFVNPPMKHRGIFDPEAAFKSILKNSVFNVRNEDGWRTRGTVTTVFSGASDGYVDSDNIVYATARSGGTLFADDTDIQLIVGQQLGFACDEGFLSYDTSSIPDTDTVSAVAHSLWDLGSSFEGSQTMEARIRDWGATLTTGDWVAGATYAGLTIVATIASASITADQYNTMTESGAAFQTAINKTGTTYLILGTAAFAAGTIPLGTTNIFSSSADETGTTQDPKLAVTHAAAAGGARMLATLGVGT